MSKVTNIDDVRIGRILKREREIRCITQVKFAEVIGCKQAILSLYESGSRTIPNDRVPAIAAALELDQRLINPKAA